MRRNSLIVSIPRINNSSERNDKSSIISSSFSKCPDCLVFVLDNICLVLSIENMNRTAICVRIAIRAEIVVNCDNFVICFFVFFVEYFEYDRVRLVSANLNK